MDELKLKELAIASSLSVQQRADMKEDEFFESEGLRREFRRTAPDAILSLLAKLESAQGEIRALRCTEAGLLSELQTLREERTAWRVTAENAEAAQSLPDGWKLVPVEPTEAIISAMMKSQARDDEGCFPMLMDHIDYSGENKTKTVVKAAYKAALAASPQPQPVQPPKRCPNCDDTGDVHSIDGEWRGVCHCPAGQAIKAAQPKD